MNAITYLDYNATTPVDPVVLDAMMPWFTGNFWNAASAHLAGRFALDAVDAAREQVASAIGARQNEIVFTSGSTESINLALKGAVAASPSRRNVITTSTEHKAVLDTAEWLKSNQSKVTIIPTDSAGVVDLSALEDALDEGTAVVSAMAANNETGVVTSLQELIEVSQKHEVLFHSDATQVIGRGPFNVEELGLDLASLSAHKIYGPKGVGALFVRRGTQLEAVTHGGGHERGLRSGTLNVPAIVGFGAAANLVTSRLKQATDKSLALVNQLVVGLNQQLVDIEIVAESTDRLPNTVNIRFNGADSDAVMANAPSIAVSSGSACSARIPSPSHVLMAMGLSSKEASECLRFSVGYPTTSEDIDKTITAIVYAVERVRELTK
jgi:cysteine desulfurase